MAEETIPLMGYTIGGGQIRRSTPVDPEPPMYLRNSRGQLIPNRKTLRDEFAIAALANSREIFNSPAEAARYAYVMADAKMEERFPTTPQTMPLATN